MDSRGMDGAYVLHQGDVLDAYSGWPVPATIVSDGAYGVRGFHGDTTSPDGLAAWYRPHVGEWSRAAHPATTLWFWNTEAGWAAVHPLLAAHGWDYVETVTWDKGLAHIAGNVNGKTIRRFPVVSEICVLYQRRLELDGPDGAMPVQQWLRHEWLRSGLPLSAANDACGVKNAATRKYLTRDWLWYWPPGLMMERLAAYANDRGTESGWPYFSLDGRTPVTAKAWDSLRYRWNHAHGLTNVWSRPPLHDAERLKGTMRRAAPRVYKPTGASAAHLNQKPLEFMERIIFAVTEPGDVVWEPFGGLASASVAAVALGRKPCVAERDEHFAALAQERLRLAVRERDIEAEGATVTALLLAGEPRPGRLAGHSERLTDAGPGSTELPAAPDPSGQALLDQLGCPGNEREVREDRVEIADPLPRSEPRDRLGLPAFLADQLLAERDTLVADVDAGPGDERPHLGIRLRAERARGDRRGHDMTSPRVSLKLTLVSRNLTASVSA